MRTMDAGIYESLGVKRVINGMGNVTLLGGSTLAPKVLAAIMVGKDNDRIARLPDTSGLKNEFLIQKPTRYHYDRAVTVPGGKLVEVGGDRETTTAQLEAAIGPRTAGVLYAARSEGNSGVLSLADVVRIARNKGI